MAAIVAAGTPSSTAAPPAAASPAAAAPKTAAPKTTAAAPKKVSKTRINLQAVGSAPQLKKTRFKIESDKPFAVLDTVLRAQLKLDAAPGGALFLYLCSGFCPALDEPIATLVDNFGTGQGKKRELVVQYCLQPAWG